MVKCVLKKKGTFSFVGVDMNNPGNGFGTVEYWINLRVPMEQALRLYKARNVFFTYFFLWMIVHPRDKPCRKSFNLKSA